MLSITELKKEISALTTKNKFEPAFKLLSEYAVSKGLNDVVNDIKGLERQYNLARKKENLEGISASTELNRIHRAIFETILPEIEKSNEDTEKPEISFEEPLNTEKIETPVEEPVPTETEDTSLFSKIISEIEKIEWAKIRLPFSGKSVLLFLTVLSIIFFAINYGTKVFIPNETDIKSNIYKGKLAYERKEYDKAFSILDKYKNDSLFDGEAQYMLAKLFRDVGSNPKDTIEALKWFLKSAKNNNPRGLNSLGYCYEHGLGVDSDVHLALRYYEKAALKGNGRAYSNMGKLYLSSALGKLDTLKGLDCLKKAAELGEEDAYYSLGEFYYSGKGGKVNYSEAYRYFELGANHNDTNSQAHLARMYYYGYGIKEDNDKAIFWMQKAAESPTYGWAHNFLGNMYYKWLWNRC